MYVIIKFVGYSVMKSLLKIPHIIVNNRVKHPNYRTEWGINMVER